MKGANVQRPSETVAGTTGTVVGAVVALLAAYGFAIPAAAVAPIIVLVGLLPAGITWVVAQRQRAGLTGSASDGRVSPHKRATPSS